MTIVLRAVCLSAILSFLAIALHAAEVPHIKMENGAGQLIVKGQPFLILGGELSNSSAGTAAQADSIIPKLAAMHVNTILMPVAWERRIKAASYCSIRIGSTSIACGSILMFQIGNSRDRSDNRTSARNKRAVSVALVRNSEDRLG